MISQFQTVVKEQLTAARGHGGFDATSPLETAVA